MLQRAVCYTRTMDTEAYDWIAHSLTAALQAAAPHALWKTATLKDLTQGGEPYYGTVDYYVVQARVPAREFLLRKGVSRSIVEQDMGGAVDLLVQLLNTRLGDPHSPKQ